MIKSNFTTIIQTPFFINDILETTIFVDNKNPVNVAQGIKTKENVFLLPKSKNIKIENDQVNKIKIIFVVDVEKKRSPIKWKFTNN